MPRSGDTVTLSWQSSDPKATVTIDQLGANFPAIGSVTIAIANPRVFSGRSIGQCGTGNDASAAVSVTSTPTGSLTPAASSMPQGNTTTITVVTATATSWTLTSSLGNPLNPSSGTTNGTRTITYTGTRPGVDEITLHVLGTCGTADQAASIVVGSSPTPQPPSGGLLCCDGTRSPSCFNCASKQGCCSSHGGVCGCP